MLSALIYKQESLQRMQNIFTSKSHKFKSGGGHPPPLLVYPVTNPVSLSRPIPPFCAAVYYATKPPPQK